MAELFDYIKESALLSGINIREYYDYSYAEILDSINAYNKQNEYILKQNTMNGYNVARMTANFVGCILSGEDMPSIEDIYRSIFSKDIIRDNNSVPENGMTNDLILLKEQFLDFAQKRNQEYNKTKKGEDI